MKNFLIRSFIIATTTFAAWIVLSLPGVPSTVRNEAVLRVGTFNLHYRNSNGKILAELLNKSDVDLALLLEFSGDNFDASISRDFGYKVIVSSPKQSPYGIALLAKNSIAVSATELPSPVSGPCPLPMIAGRINFNSHQISFLGVHAPPPVPTCGFMTKDVIGAFTKDIANGMLTENLGAAECGDKVILFGDFNAMPFDNAISSVLGSGLHDSYAASNWRPGPTWTPFSFMPSVARIDYIFVPRGLHIIDSWSVRLPGSDHRAVISDIEMLNPNKTF